MGTHLPIVAYILIKDRWRSTMNISGKLRTFALDSALTSALGAASATPALADWHGRWHDGGWRGWHHDGWGWRGGWGGWHDRWYGGGWRGHDWGDYYVPGYWGWRGYAPGYTYTPPAVIYPPAAGYGVW